MPVKKWYNLKDPIDREAARVWAESLGIPDLTTRELVFNCVNKVDYCLY